MRVGEIRQFCRLPEDGQSLMRAAMSQLNLSARAYHRILKLARTISDLAACEEIQSVHLAEADVELRTQHQDKLNKGDLPSWLGGALRRNPRRAEDDCDADQYYCQKRLHQPVISTDIQHH